LDVAYERKEDGAQVIGQTLNEHATENQQVSEQLSLSAHEEFM
jgi:hypothetical protein